MSVDEKNVAVIVFELVKCEIHNARVALAYKVGPVQLEEISAEDYSAVNSVADGVPAVCFRCKSEHFGRCLPE